MICVSMCVMLWCVGACVCVVLCMCVGIWCICVSFYVMNNGIGYVCNVAYMCVVCVDIVGECCVVHVCGVYVVCMGTVCILCCVVI